MKKIGILMIMALLLVSVVSATTSTLSDQELTMAYVDVVNVQFCAFHNNGSAYPNLPVVVSPVCKDLNSIEGCQPADDMAQTVFTAVPVNGVTDVNGCDTITLTTNVANPADGGTFYYTANGQAGDVTITSATGTVLVPEFGVVAALGILGAAGFFISRKRK